MPEMKCNETERIWACEDDVKPKAPTQMLGYLLIGIALLACDGICLVKMPLIEEHQGTHLPDIPSIDKVGLSFSCGDHQHMGVAYFRKMGSVQVLHEEAWPYKGAG